MLDKLFRSSPPPDLLGAYASRTAMTNSFAEQQRQAIEPEHARRVAEWEANDAEFRPVWDDSQLRWRIQRRGSRPDLIRFGPGWMPTGGPALLDRAGFDTREQAQAWIDRQLEERERARASGDVLPVFVMTWRM